MLVLAGVGFAAAAGLASSDVVASFTGTSGSDSGTTSTQAQGPPEYTVDTSGDLVDVLSEPEPGTIIHLEAGTYDLYDDLELSNLSISSADVQLLGAGRDDTTIKLRGKLSIKASGVVVEGIAFVGPGVWNDDTHEISNLPDRPGPLVDITGSITNVTFSDNSVTGGYRGVALEGGGEGSPAASDSAVTGNELFHNVVAVLVDGGAGNDIRDNHIHDNGNAAEGRDEQPQAAVLIRDRWGVLGDEAAANVVSGNLIVNTVNHGIMVRTSGNTISGNTISNSGTGYPAFDESSGITINGSDDNNGANDNTIGANTIVGSAFAGIRLTYYVDGTTIDGNLVANTQRDDEYGGDAGAAILFAGSATQTAITGNLLAGNSGYGIFVAESGICEIVCNVAHGNAIVGNELGGVVNLDESDFDATSNWWGSDQGPSREGVAAGDSVSDGVLFDPWLTVAPAIGQAGTTTMLASSANPSELGEPVTLTATVTSDGDPVSGGSVQFLDGDAALGGPQSLNEDGVATLTVSSLAAGAHTIRASFSGDDTRAASTSAPFSQVVNAPVPPPPTTTTTVAPPPTTTTTTVAPPQSDVGVSVSGPTSVRVGEQATFTAAVKNAGPDASTGVELRAPVPAGSTFVSASLSNGNPCGLSGGIVQCTVGTLGAGASATASVVVTAGAAGPLTLSASVQGDYDASGGNNGSSATTTVLTPTAPPLPPPPPTQPGTFNAVGTGTVTINGTTLPSDSIVVLNSGDTVDVAGGSLTFTTVDGDFASFSGVQPSARRTSGRAHAAAASDVPAQFKVSQAASAGAVTELTLIGGDFSKCKATRLLSAKDKTPVRQLWGSAKGKFRTRARFSSATVRGTVWLTQDRCDGSLTQVTESVVDVLDLSLNKTVAVSAGQSYLALPKAVKKPTTKTTPKKHTVKKTAKSKQLTYVVQRGDSLSSIATAKLGQEHRWVDLAKLNGLKPPYVVQPGTKLKLPGG